MASAALRCPRCVQSLPTEAIPLAALTACPFCQCPLEITLFPSFGRGPVLGQAGESRTTDGDAACFFHPAKKAKIPCDQCGRFLCALCDLELESQHFCPTCLNSKKGELGPRSLEKERFRWDNLVWVLVLSPILTILCTGFAPITSAIAVGIGVWKFQAPPSRIARSRLRLGLGLLTASCIVIGTAVLVLLKISDFI